MILWRGLDVGAVLLIDSLRFFAGRVAVVPSGKPGWVYLSLLITLAAFAAGGYVAARRRSAPDAGGAAAVGAGTGPFVAAVLLVVALFHAERDGLVLAAVALPLLWAAVGAAGGLYEAAQRGLVTGVEPHLPDGKAGDASSPDGVPPGEQGPPASV